MLDVMRKRIKQAGVRNVTPVLSRDDDPLLPNGRCDLAVIISTSTTDARGPRRSCARLVSRPRCGGTRDQRGLGREIGVRAAASSAACREARGSVRDAQSAPDLKLIGERTFLPHQYFLVLRRARLEETTLTKVFLDYDQVGARSRLRSAGVGAEHARRSCSAVRPPATPCASRLGRRAVWPTAPARSSASTSIRRSRPHAPVMIFLPRRRLAGRRRAQPGLRGGDLRVGPAPTGWCRTYATVMDVGLEGMVAQVRRAVAWVAQNAASFGGDAARIYVRRPLLGRAPGGQRARHRLGEGLRPAGRPREGRALHQRDVRPEGGATVSPLVLREVRRPHRARAQSAAPPRPAHARSVVALAYASNDSPEFQRQSREFAAALERIGRLRRLVVGEGHNHFELPETARQP